MMFQLRGEKLDLDMNKKTSPKKIDRDQTSPEKDHTERPKNIDHVRN